MSLPIEPSRWAVTGGGMGIALRDGYEDAERAGECLDAPGYIAAGSVAGSELVPMGWTTVERDE